jgi:hypothetical protein
MVAWIIVAVLVLLLAPMAVYDLRQRRRGRRVMTGAQNPRWDALGRPEAYFPTGGMGGDGGGGSN